MVEKETVEIKETKTPREKKTKKMAKVLIDALNIRPNPNTNNIPLSVCEKDDKLEILDILPDGDWVKISFNGLTGYVMSKYISY